MFNFSCTNFYIPARANDLESLVFYHTYFRQQIQQKHHEKRTYKCDFTNHIYTSTRRTYVLYYIYSQRMKYRFGKEPTSQLLRKALKLAPKTLHGILVKLNLQAEVGRQAMFQAAAHLGLEPVPVEL